VAGAPRAVLLDAYETLIAVTERIAPYSELIAAAGLTGEAARAAARWLQTHEVATLPEAAASLAGQLGGRPIEPAVVARLEAVLARHLASFVLADGAAACIAALRERGFAVALVSNVSTPYKEPIRRLGIPALVDTLVLSCEVGVAKPDAGIFHLALERLGVAPEAAVMVGDSPGDDVAGARAAGLHAIHLDPAGAPRHAATITGLAQLPDRAAALLPVASRS
jgi:HAD superfamily hydrolase (TIGR01509 family)